MTVQGVERVDPQWRAFARFSTAFSMIALCFAALVVVAVLVIVIVMWSHDLYFARRILREKKGLNNDAWKTRKSGVV